MTDTGEDYWATTDALASRYGISDRAARKNVARHDLGLKIARDCGGLEWMAALPVYEAWRIGDTGLCCDERRDMKILAERLSVP
jgi:hypothetical protein